VVFGHWSGDLGKAKSDEGTNGDSGIAESEECKDEGTNGNSGTAEPEEFKIEGLFTADLITELDEAFKNHPG